MHNVEKQHQRDSRQKNWYSCNGLRPSGVANYQILTSHLFTIAQKCYLGFPCLPELSSHYRVRHNRPAKAINTARVLCSHARYSVLFSLIVQRLFAL